MLNSFLRDIYKSKVISKVFLEKNLKCWTIGDGNITKTFTFKDFKSAMTFLSLSGEYAEEYGISASISNVYNRVTVSIVKQELTTIDFKAAIYFNQIGGVDDSIESVINTDYENATYSLPKNLKINNLIPTDPWDSKNSFLIEKNSDENLKLI